MINSWPSLLTLWPSRHIPNLGIPNQGLAKLHLKRGVVFPIGKVSHFLSGETDNHPFRCFFQLERSPNSAAIRRIGNHPFRF